MSQNPSRKNSIDSPIVVKEDTIKSLDQIQTTEEMNQFLFKIGSYLMQDKQKLSQWLRGLQEGFAEFYVLCKHLYIESRELEILRDFLVLRVENLKLRVHELLNEKEDMVAMHGSDSKVKEHLIQKMNELEKQFMERSTELLFQKRRVQELTDDKNDFDNRFERAQNEISEFK